MDLLSEAIKIARSGWPVFPCNPKDKRPIGKLVPHGLLDATTDEAVITQWWTQVPTAMIGVPMGSRSGVYAADLDKKGNGIDGVATWKAMQQDHGTCPPTRVHHTPSTGQHYLFQWEEGIRSIPLGKLAPGLEIKGEGGYIVVPPSVMEDGKTYRGNGLPVAPTPPWLLSMIRAYLEDRLADPKLESEVEADAGRGTSTKEEDLFFAKKPATREQIEEALWLIPAEGYTRWMLIAAALHSLLGASGYSLFEKWSSTGKSYEGVKDCRLKWKQTENMKHITGGTLFYLVGQADPTGWAKFKAKRRQEWAASLRNEGIIDQINEQIKDDTDKDKKSEQGKGKGNGHDTSQQQRQQQRVPSLIQSSAEFIANFVPPDYLIDGLLQRAMVYAMTGPTGEGKTSIALLMAFHVAMGRSLDNREIDAGKVLFLAGENPDDVRMRWIKLLEEMDVDAKDVEVYFMPGSLALSDKVLREYIKNHSELFGPFSLIVIDTSAAFFEGDDENVNTQMMAHARMMRGLSNLIKGRPTVLVLCHPVKNYSRDNMLPRGGGAFLNEIDGNLTCMKMENTMIAEIHWQGKFRGVDFNAIPFQMQVGKSQKIKDSKGRLLWTVTAHSISEGQRQAAEDATQADKTKLMAAMLHGYGASIADLAEQCGWYYKDGKPNRSHVQRLMNALMEDKLVKKERGRYVLTKVGKRAEQPDKPMPPPSNMDLPF